MSSEPQRTNDTPQAAVEKEWDPMHQRLLEYGRRVQAMPPTYGDEMHRRLLDRMYASASSTRNQGTDKPKN